MVGGFLSRKGKAPYCSQLRLEKYQGHHYRHRGGAAAGRSGGVVRLDESTQQGGVTVTCSLQEGRVIVTVADTGVGIHAAGLGQLFAKPKPGTLLRGRGLSLYVARLLAKTMRGDVTLVSTEVENGSTFAVVFPQASKMPAADPAAEPAAVSKA